MRLSHNVYAIARIVAQERHLARVQINYEERLGELTRST